MHSIATCTFLLFFEMQPCSADFVAAWELCLMNANPIRRPNQRWLLSKSNKGIIQITLKSFFNHFFVVIRINRTQTSRQKCHKFLWWDRFVRKKQKSGFVDSPSAFRRGRTRLCQYLTVALRFNYRFHLCTRPNFRDYPITACVPTNKGASFAAR